MKKLNRILALVLAGVMTLAMLTGCSTGTETEVMGEKLIEETLKAFNSMRDEDDQLANDEELKVFLDAALSMIDPETDKFDTDKWRKSEYYNVLSERELYMEILLEGREDGGLYATPVTEDNFNDVLRAFTNAAEAFGEARAFGKAKAIAVSYRDVNSKLYVGFLVEF